MKKNFICIGFLLGVCVLGFSFESGASPTPGDWIQGSLLMTDSSGNRMLGGSLEVKIIGLDLEAGTFTSEHVYQDAVTGERSVEVNADLISGYPTESELQSIVDYCPNYGGIAETLETRRGPMNVCNLPVDDEESVGRIWVGVVPFGMLKADVVNKADQTRVQTEVHDFHFN